MQVLSYAEDIWRTIRQSFPLLSVNTASWVPYFVHVGLVRPQPNLLHRSEQLQWRYVQNSDTHNHSKGKLRSLTFSYRLSHALVDGYAYMHTKKGVRVQN
jgi:hypothetical protein